MRSKKHHEACPFCGSARTFCRVSYDPDGKWHVVVCGQCCAEGPRAETAARAYRLWDERSPAQGHDPRRCPFCKRVTAHWVHVTCFPSARRPTRSRESTRRHRPAAASRSKT